MINLLYCGNKKVFDGMLISLLSIIKHYKGELNVFVLTMDLSNIDEKHIPVSAGQIEYLEKVLKDVNEKSELKRIDITELFLAEMADSVNMQNFYTPYCLLRLFADLILELPEKLIYLDTDTVANGDISSLFKYDVSEYEFAGTIDYLGKWFKNRKYINSGVLLLNLKKIRETGLFEKTREVCKNKKMAFPDQDALNKYAVSKMFLPTKYNSQRRYHSDDVIQHFCKSIRLFPFFHTINIKPWEVEKVQKIYKNHAYDDILLDYQKRIMEIKEMKL